ncbi:MAG: acyltransferase family protein [Acetobacteraceae bacterium]|nr:acyltransferase family protein [Acetobacteraceae bacterium]
MALHSRPSADLAGAGGQRVAWLDIARGSCMVLVVLLHADFALGRIEEHPQGLYLLNLALVPLRLPLFFLVSGMLAARMLRRPAREVLRRRVLHYLWLYCLWWVLQHGFHAGLAGVTPPALMESFESPGSIAGLLTAAVTKLWFLLALALFYLAALGLARLPAAAHMAVAIALAVPGTLELGEAAGLPILDRFYDYPFFALGLTAGQQIQEAASWLGARFHRLLPCAAAWVLATIFVHRAGLLTDNLAVAGLSVLALPVGFGAAAWAAGSARRWTGPLALIGRNTLTIYVLHPMALHLLILLVPRPQPLPPAAWVIMVTLAAVLLSFLCGRWLGRIPGLFRLPGPGPATWLRRWGRPRTRPPSAPRRQGLLRPSHSHLLPQTQHSRRDPAAQG